MQPFATLVMLHIKFDQDWLTGLRDIQVRKRKIFKIRLVRAFIPVLVTSNFDDDSIKNERASMKTVFSHHKSMGIFLDAQGS